MTFDKAQAELRARGLWLEREYDAWVAYRREWGVPHERAVVASGATWQEAYTNATGRTAF